MNECPCINLNKLPRIEAVEGASFDRTFTLLDEQGNPYTFSPNAISAFSIRTRMDSVIVQIVATVLPLPGHVRFQILAAQTVGRVGRFIWSGTITDGSQVIVLEANEFYLKEGMLGEVAPEPPDPVPPPNRITWNVLNQSAQLAVNNAYVVDSLSLALLQLPATAGIGDRVIVYLKSGSFRIMQAASQQCQVGDKTTTTGLAGSILSIRVGDLIELTFLGTVWVSAAMIGNFEIL